MIRIEFETSLGIVRGTITDELKDYEDYGNKYIVKIDDDCLDNLDHFYWLRIFIYNDTYCKLELLNNSNGYPEYKYKRIKNDKIYKEESYTKKKTMEFSYQNC